MLEGGGAPLKFTFVSGGGRIREEGRRGRSGEKHYYS